MFEGCMEDKKYKAIIEAILFTMGESVELEKIADAIELDKKKTKKLINEMMQEWNDEGRGVAIMELDGAYQMCTRTEMYEYLIRIAKQPKRFPLSLTSSRSPRWRLRRSVAFPRIMQ